MRDFLEHFKFAQPQWLLLLVPCALLFLLRRGRGSEAAITFSTLSVLVSLGAKVRRTAWSVGLPLAMFAIVAAIFALHVYWFVRVRRIARAELDHVSCVPKEGLEQKGYRSHCTGTCIKVLSILYALWMQAPILTSQRGSALW